MKYRSKLEARVAKLPALARAKYEPFRLAYPKADGHYTPDFWLPNGILLEVKGFFRAVDRTKMLSVQRAHPTLDIRFVLQEPRKLLSKSSKTSYADWCTKFGFKWCASTDAPILDRWAKER